MRLTFIDGSITADNTLLEKSPFPLFNAALDDVDDARNEDAEINFPAQEKTFSVIGFKEYLNYLNTENKTRFVFSNDWDQAVINNPSIAFKLIEMADYFMDEGFINHAFNYTLQVLHQNEITTDVLTPHLDLLNLSGLSAEQHQKLKKEFLNIFFLEKRPLLENSALVSSDSLKFIFEQLTNQPYKNTAMRQNKSRSVFLKTISGTGVYIDLFDNDDSLAQITKKAANVLSADAGVTILENEVSLLYAGKLLTQEQAATIHGRTIHILPKIVSSRLLSEANITSLEKLKDTNAHKIITAIASVDSFYEKIEKFNNNFGSKIGSVDSTIKSITTELQNSIQILNQDENINQEDKDYFTKIIQEALEIFKDLIPRIELFEKLFHHNILIGNIPKQIRAIDELIETSSKDINFTIELEQKIFSTYQLIESALALVEKQSSLQLNEAEQQARTRLHEQLSNYKHSLLLSLKTALNEGCVENTPITLFSAENLLAPHSQESTSLPEANNTSLQTPIITRNKAPFLILIDHGGVLDGKFGMGNKEDVIRNESALIIDDEGDYFNYLPYGRDVLQILNDLEKMGCIISSHSANREEDQSKIWTQLYSAVPGTTPPKLGDMAIYNQTLTGQSSSNPICKRASIVGNTINIFEFGPGEKEGKDGVREILLGRYNTTKENVFILDDAEKVLYDAVDEGYQTENCFWITNNETAPTYRMFNKWDLLAEALNEIKNRITAKLEAEAQSANRLQALLDTPPQISTPVNNPQPVTRELMEEVRAAFLETNSLVDVIHQLSHLNHAEIFNAAIFFDRHGDNSLKKIVEQKPDDVAEQFFRFLFSNCNNDVENYINSKHFTDKIIVQALANFKDKSFDYLSSLINKPAPTITPTFDQQSLNQGGSNLGKRKRDSSNSNDQNEDKDKPDAKRNQDNNDRSEDEPNAKRNAGCTIS